MKLRIRPQMVFGFLVMSSLLLIVSVLAVFYTNRIQQNTSRILVENVSSLKSAEELEIALLDMKGLTANYFLLNQDKWLKIFDEKKLSFMKWLKEAREKSHSIEEKVILDDIEKQFKLYLKYHRISVQSFHAANTDRANEIQAGKMQVTFNKIYQRCEELLTVNENLMNNTSLKIERDNRTIKQIMYGIGIIGILLGLGLGWFFASHITHSIYELVLKVKGATNEDIVEKVEIADETELEHLGRHVKKLIDKVHVANKDLERNQRLLFRSEKLASLGQMAAGLAHEIRNPLTAIKMLVFSLEKELKNKARLNKDFTVIIHEIERMESFLQSFLNFARPPDPEFGIIEINELLNHTENLLIPQIKSAKIKMQKEFTSDILEVYGDREQLQQVFVNIILNAIQSMPNGGVLNVKTSFEHDPIENIDLVQINVSDTGKGIPHEIFNVIFDPFISSKEAGVGLGLSIAYQIIHQHNGWIEAANNPEKGATFSINLPKMKGKA